MKSIAFDEAALLASAWVEKLGQGSGDDFEILPQHTKELVHGWLFFFNSSEFVRTGNPLASLAGNGPILVARDGRLYELPSAKPWEEALAEIGFS